MLGIACLGVLGRRMSSNSAGFIAALQQEACVKSVS